MQWNREFGRHFHTAHAQVDRFGNLLDFELFIDDQINEFESPVSSSFLTERLGSHDGPVLSGLEIMGLGIPLKTGISQKAQEKGNDGDESDAYECLCPSYTFPDLGLEKPYL